MDYFKYELWLGINSDNKDEQIQAEKQWKTNTMLYEQRFNCVSKYLSKSFVSAYDQTSGFHDYNVTNIYYDSYSKLVYIEVLKKDINRTIIYHGVSGFEFRMANVGDSMQMSDLLEWGYDEFSKIQNGTLKHGILFSSGMEFEIRFKNVRVSKKGLPKENKGSTLCIL